MVGSGYTTNTTETQLESYLAILPRLGRLQREVYEAISASPSDLTCAEVEELLGMRHQTASARINELSGMGMIRITGKAWNAETHRHIWRYRKV
mgnify:CR=1 FL=1